MALIQGDDGNNQLFAGDTNGDGASDFHIILSGHVSLTATDFVL